MGWFDEQIRQRKISDEEAFREAFVDMAGIVMGAKVKAAMNDSIEQAKNAMEEVLKYYHIRLKEFNREFDDWDEELDHLLHPFGLMKRNVNLTEGWYLNAAGPMLGVLKSNSTPVALMPGPFGGYSFFDSTNQKRIFITAKNAELLEDEALCFYQPFPQKKLTAKDIISYMFKSISVSDVTFMVVIVALGTLIGMIMPRLMYWLYSDELINTGSVNSLVAIAIFMICAQVSSTMMAVLQNLTLTRIQGKLTLYVEAASMMRVLSLPTEFFKNYNSGEVVQRMNYISSLSTTISSIVFSTGLTSLFSLVYITQIFNYAPILVAPALTVIFVTLLVSTLTTIVQMRISKEHMEHMAAENGLTYSLITGIQKIKLSGAEKRAFAKWSKSYTNAAKQQYDPPMLLKINGVISTAIGLIGTVVIYFFAIRGGVSVAEYTAFNAAYAMVFGAIRSIFSIAFDIAGIKPILEMVEPIFSALPEVAGDKKVVEKLSGGIELNNVTFRYTDDGPAILDDLSLKIRPGQYIAIAGKTGCGKSTLMRILLGFEIPQKGAVYYDGKDIKKLDLQSLRRNIGSVMQNGKLIMGSIYENLVISAPSLTMEEAWAAAETAGIASDIREMPMGMQTVIGEGSGGISGGQRQRLLIARAIAPKPKILMFDEATSALDNMTQREVSDALDNLKCTRLVIAHRLSTIKNADRIIVLDKGKIIEDGSYEELIANNGYFADLVERQRLDK